MAKSPFRRDPPDRNKRPNNLPPINPDFKDISNPEDMLTFIKANRHVIHDQDAEIDNSQNQNSLEADEPTPLKNTEPRDRRRMMPVQETHEPDIIEEELEPYQDSSEDDAAEEKQSSQAPSSQTPPKNPFKNIDMSKLDPATRKRLEESMKDRPNQKVISNVPEGKDIAVAAPRISDVQMRRKVEKEYREELKNNPDKDPLSPPKTQMRFSINTPQNAIEYDWERFEPVSGCVFYEKSEIFVRRFNLVDTMRVSKAMETSDISGFIDALGNCIQEGFNIRDMSYPDFRHYLYWHWFNSYTKVPHDLSWTSKYGNKNLYKVSESNLKLVPPSLSREEYLEWHAKGFAVPTVRDAEIFMKEELNEDELYLLNRAQYFAGDPRNPSIQSKIDGMTLICSKSTLPIQELPDFKKAIHHEVVESVDVLDAKFNPQTWIEVLQGQIKILDNEIKGYEAEGDALSALGSEDERLEVEKEIARLEQGIEDNKGGAELADVETIRLDRPILNFFPYI